MATNKIYNADSTQHLDAREFNRKRPGANCGSTEYSTQLLRELFANALDEHNIGHGDVITITIDTKKNSYTVADNGQGFIPNAPKPNGETMFSECYSIINTSGKYDDSDESIYAGSALGLNGIGMKLQCYLSLESVGTTSDGSGKRETIYYKDGLFQKREITKEEKNVHGTSITYIPDPQFFTHAEADMNEVRKMFIETSALCPNLTIYLVVDGKEEKFISPNGLDDLMDTKAKNKEILSSRFKTKKYQGENDFFDICFTYTSDYSDNIISYVNYGETKTGPHITALKTAITRNINKFAKEKKYLKEKDSNLTGAELAPGMTIIFNLKAKKVRYDAQVKTSVVDIDKTLISEAMNDEFIEWMENHSKDIKTIVDRALLERKAADAAKKAREAARESKTPAKKAKIANLPTKLVDCSCADRSKAELIVCEGDSAASGLVAARDDSTQAIFGLRGKMINAFKNQNDKVMANQEVNNIIKALGLQMGANGKLIYDTTKLRYGKIIAATDGDPDGSNIRMLIAVNLWNLCPELIINGHFYIAYAPLFRITTKKNEYVYLKDDNALNDYRNTHKGDAYTVNRLKGLGECDSTELAPILLEESTRNVQQVVVSDPVAAKAHLEMLMGTTVTGRRQFLLENGNKANELYVKGE